MSGSDKTIRPSGSCSSDVSISPPSDSGSPPAHRIPGSCQRKLRFQIRLTSTSWISLTETNDGNVNGRNRTCPQNSGRPRFQRSHGWTTVGIATRQGNMRSRSKLRAMLSHDSFLGVIENEYVARHVIVSELAWYILVVTEKSRSIRRSTKAKPTCAIQ